MSLYKSRKSYASTSKLFNVTSGVAYTSNVVPVIGTPPCLNAIVSPSITLNVDATSLANSVNIVLKNDSPRCLINA